MLLENDLGEWRCKRLQNKKNFKQVKIRKNIEFNDNFSNRVLLR